MTTLHPWQTATLLRQPTVFDAEDTFQATTPRWSLSSLAADFAHQRVVTSHTQDRRFARLLDDDGGLRLDRLLRRMARLHKQGRTHDLPYLRNVWLRESFSSLVADVQLPDVIVGDNALMHPQLRPHVPEMWTPWLEFFISYPGVVYPEVHVDTHHTHAWLWQVQGKKRAYFWPAKIDVDPWQKTASDDDTRVQRIDNSFEQVAIGEDADLQTLFDHAEPVVVDLPAGHIALVPAGWWHTTQTLEPSITLSGNFVSPDVVRDFLCSVERSPAGPGWAKTLHDACAAHGETLCAWADECLLRYDVDAAVRGAG